MRQKTFYWKGRLRATRSFVLLAALVLASCTTLKRCAYEGVNRDEWQKPDEVIRALGIQPGERIADLGSGSGYFTFRLAKEVGPMGKVYAVDIDKGLNKYVADRARQEGYANIEVILAKPDDPLLPQAGVDMIFTSNTYHHLENRPGYFANFSNYLSPNGRIAIVEFNEKGWFQSLSHYSTADVIKKEMKEAGYQLQREFDFLPRQSFLIFSKNPN